MIEDFCEGLWLKEYVNRRRICGIALALGSLAIRRGFAASASGIIGAAESFQRASSRPRSRGLMIGRLKGSSSIGGRG